MIRPYEQHEQEIIERQKGNPSEEICGILIEENGLFTVQQIANQALDKEHIFEMDYAPYKNKAAVMWHTHPGVGDLDGPSDADKYWSAKCQLPICIYVRRTGKFHYWQPGDYHASIVGRPWCPGIFDCFALIRDALYEFFELDFPDLNRNYLHATVGLKEVDQYWQSIGGEIVHQPGKGRVALINHGGSRYVNHVSLLVSESQMLHQLRGHPSRIEFYSDTWKRSTLYWIRHAKIDQEISRRSWSYGVKNQPAVASLPQQQYKAWNPLLNTRRMAPGSGNGLNS